MKALFKSVLIVLGVTSIVLALALVLNGITNFQDYPDVLPEGHHANSADYQWKVVIDPSDEKWVFYTDTQPTFSMQENGQGETRTVICMESPRKHLRFGKDEFYTGTRCVGGEGKIDIIPQGTRILY